MIQLMDVPHLASFLPVSEANEYVFHYTTGSIALEHILADKKLKLSPFCDTHDPREAKGWRFSFTSSGGRLGRAMDFKEGQEEWLRNWLGSTDITTKAKQESKLLCTTLDGRDAQSAQSTLYDRGFVRSRMWDQYADRHKGVCLAFRRQLLDEQIKLQFDSDDVYSGPVKYSDQETGEFVLSYDKIQEKSLEDAVAEHLVEYRNDLFFHKLRDWESENEYRWLAVTRGSAEPEYVDYGASLCGVILGVDFPQVYDVLARELCGEHVKIQRLGYHNGMPHIEFPDQQV